MQKIRWTLLLLSLSLAISTTFINKANAMRFHGRPPPPSPMFAVTAWYVFGEGEIDDKSGEQLLEFLLASNVPKRSLMFLNSPGGSLLGGMKLGKAIRQHELFTYVGIDKKEGEFGTTSPGE